MRTLITKILKRLDNAVLSPGWTKAWFHRLLWALLIVPASAWGDIRLVLSDSSPHYQQIAEDIGLYLEKFHPGVRHSRSVMGTAGEIATTDELIIAIGTKAAEGTAEDYPDNPVLYLFITHKTWGKLNNSRGKKAAIIIDQPTERYLQLARLIAPDARTLGTVYGPISANHQVQFQATAIELGFELVSQSVTRESNPLEVISPIFNVSDIFIALPDEALINRNLAQWALHLGFKNQIPIIGFSHSYTKAGALASIFTSPENISRQSLEWLNDYLAVNRLPAWQELSPQYFTITVNSRVMGALGLRLDTKELMAKMSPWDTTVRPDE